MTLSPKNVSQGIQQIHRWTCIAFVLSVVTYIVVMTRGPVPAWLNIFPAGTLILLLATGLYMFALPYTRKRQVAPQPAE